MKSLVSKVFTGYHNNISKIIYYTCAITLGIIFIERLFIIFSYEAHTAGIDNNFNYPIIRALAGFSMYPDPEDYPYAVNPYAPLFFIVCKWAASLLGINATNTIAVYWVSRSVCLLADIGTCIFFFRILRKLLKIDTAVSLISISLLFCIVSFLGYTLNRSDSFFLFFYCSSLFVLLRFSGYKTIWFPILLAVLTTLCIFSKQNGIILLGLIPSWFILEKNYRSLIIFLLFSTIFFTATFLYFQYIFTDQFFSKHIIDALNNKIDPRWFYVYIFKLIAPTYLTLPIAVSLVISVKSIAENNHPVLKKLGALCLLQFLFSTALSFKWGSSQGYYNESFLLGFIVMALFFRCRASQTQKSIIRGILPYFYPALCIFIIHMVAQLYFFFLNGKTEAKAKYDEQEQISQYIQREIGEENRYIIDLSNADFNFFKNMLFKECAAPNIDAVSCCTLPDNIFNYSGLLDGLQNGKIMFIIKEKGAIINAVWNINIQHYTPDTTFTRYSIYKYAHPGF
ncbi:MAG: hypothetical protein KF862_15485 [Chitinophagaceae bacterium]|nr:hypothetical protein [Chitinophagaceae bacterium]